LSGLRDTRILLDSLDRLAGASPEKPLDVASVRQELETRRIHLHQEMAERGLEPIRNTLATAIARVDDWPVAPRNWRTIRDGLEPVYRRGRRSMHIAAEACSDENLHEWRKRSKALWYQLQVLEGLWPGMLEPLAEQVHRLTDLLGDDHDLAVLAGLIRGNGAMGLPPEAREPLLERIESKRADLREEAFALGRRVYAEKAGCFVKRLGQYWQASRGSDSDGGMRTRESCGIEENVIR
jgi:CHAD domain-containing protein